MFQENMFKENMSQEASFEEKKPSKNPERNH